MDNGVWVDFTPRPSGLESMVLLESPLAEEKTKVELTPEALSKALEERLLLGGLVPPTKTSHTGDSSPTRTISSRKPPDPPPKLAFTGDESIEDLCKLLRHGEDEAVSKAAATLAAQAAVSKDDANRIVSAGGIRGLVLCVRHGLEKSAAPLSTAAEHAAHALTSIGDAVEHQQELAATGLIPMAVELLDKGTSVALREAAAGIIGNMAIKNPENQAAIVAAGALPKIASTLKDGDDSEKEQCCFALWNIVCEHAENQREAVTAGVIRPLVSLIHAGSESLKEEAAGALMNLAAQDDAKIAIAEAGGVEELVRLLTQVDCASQQAAGALMNLASDNVANQRAIVAAGAVSKLATMIDPARRTSRRTREYCAGALMNLIADRTEVKIEIVKLGTVDWLVSMLREQGDGQPDEVVGALSSLADGHPSSQKCIAECGAIALLVKELRSDSPSTREEVSAALMNLAKLEYNRKLIFEAGAIGPVVNLLRSDFGSTAEFATGIVSLLAKGEANMLSSICESGAVEILIQLIDESKSPDTVSYATVAIAALLSSQEFHPNLKASAERATKALVPVLVKMNSPAAHSAASALGGLARHCYDGNSSALENYGVLEALVKAVAVGSEKLAAEAAASIALISRTSKVLRDKACAIADPFEPLVLLACRGSALAKRNAADAIKELSVTPSNRNAAIAASAVEILTKFLISDMTVSNTDQGEAAISAAMECLARLLLDDELLQSTFLASGGLHILKSSVGMVGLTKSANALRRALADCFDDLFVAATHT